MTDSYDATVIGSDAGRDTLVRHLGVPQSQAEQAHAA